MDDLRSMVLEWLRSGSEDAVDIVDLPWEVKEVDENTYVAEHPKMPFTLIVHFTPEFVVLEAPTNLQLADFPSETQLMIYRTLMELNDAVFMMKFATTEPNETVALRVDLSRKTLGKEEFNDALTSLAVGLLVGVMSLGVEEEFVENFISRIIETLQEKIRKGYTYDQLMEFLTVRVGVPEKDAREILDEVLKSMGEEFERP